MLGHHAFTNRTYKFAKEYLTFVNVCNEEEELRMSCDVCFILRETEI